MSFTFWTVEEMALCYGKQLHPPLLSSGGSWSLLGSAPICVPLRTPRLGLRPDHHHESHGAFMNKVTASYLVYLSRLRVISTNFKDCYERLHELFMFQEGYMHSLQRKRQNGHVAEEKSNGQMSKFRTDIETSDVGEFICVNTVPANSSTFRYDCIWCFWNLFI